MEEERRFSRLEDSVKEIKEQQAQIKEQQTHMEARLATMENSIKHMEEIMNKWMIHQPAPKNDAKRSKNGSGNNAWSSGPKMKHAKLEFPSSEDDGSSAEDWVLWPIRAIGCCDS